MSDASPDISKLAALDDDEWLRVERAYCGRLMAYVSRRVADRASREDIVQEAFLGAVRGIRDFDPSFTFEQYLFGIARNRTIDHLRRRRAAALERREGEEGAAPIDTIASPEESPSALVRRADLSREGARILREWVQETWEQGEHARLCIVEALLVSGVRNRDLWKPFDLRDETSVAGIKFRALRRMAEMARERDPSGTLLEQVAGAVEEGGATSELLVREAWRASRASCPSRHWLARRIAGTLEEGPASFVRFHLEETRCEWCLANEDDLRRLEGGGDLAPFLDRVEASTRMLLRSRGTPAERRIDGTPP